MKRLLVLFTGGTIASGMSAQGKTPSGDRTEELNERLKPVFQNHSGGEAICRQPWGVPGIDSSFITPSHWLTMTSVIASELEQGLSGVLILHGTDTMANTAAWMDLCFGSLPMPVILTGSQLTLDYMPEDVTSNLRGAAQVCSSHMTGVWIYFSWKLYPGMRAHKRHALHPDAFTVINGQPLYFDPKWGLADHSDDRPLCRDIPPQVSRLLDQGEANLADVASQVRTIHCMPGEIPILGGNERFLILVGYGAGNASPQILDVVASCCRPGYTHIIACSQAEEGMKDPSNYADVGMAQLAHKGFSVWSQQTCTLEFIHSLCSFIVATGDDADPWLSRYLERC